MPPEASRPQKLVLRLLFIVILCGGAWFWGRSRKPVDMTLAVDLTRALPGEISGIDVIVRRDGRPITRHEMSFGAAGAPATVEMVVHASPGTAEIESTLNYPRKPSRRVTATLDLQADGTNTLRVE